MNGCIIAAVVAGVVDFIGGGLKIADYVCARYYKTTTKLDKDRGVL